MREIRIGVVSTRSRTTFSREVAKHRIALAFDDALAHFAPRGVKRLTIVLGSLEGVLATVHKEAKKRRWKVEALPHDDQPEPPFNANELSILGRDWGESSSPFVAAVDGIIEIGKDEKSHQETLEATERMLPFFGRQLLMLSIQPEPAQAV